MFKKNSHTFLYKTIAMIAMMVIVLVIVLEFVTKISFSEWRNVQKGYYKELKILQNSDVEDDDVAIHQIEISDFQTTDRCMTCHLGIDNSIMKDRAQPFGAHPGDFLMNHPIESFGCTICHAGQGEAIDKKMAKGTDENGHWPYPLLKKDEMQSACIKCHLSVYSKNEPVKGMEIASSGLTVFKKAGCLGCHKVDGLGGAVGPDLSHLGDKGRNEYSFKYVEGEKTIENWHLQHLTNPEKISPGTLMISFSHLSIEDLNSLVVFVRGLSGKKIPFELLSKQMVLSKKSNRDALKGKEAFGYFCASCHQQNGEGRDYASSKNGSPGILNKGFTQVASPEYIAFILKHGRPSNNPMTSFDSGFSGLKSNEIEELVNFVIQGRSTETVSASNGNKGEGKSFFNNHCSFCHGASGEGAVGPALNKSYLARSASPDFILKTIANGRPNTAMPSWRVLGTQTVNDLYGFLEQLQGTSFQEKKMLELIGDAKNGRDLFHFRCSRCHGEDGEGGIGTAIQNKHFLDAADNSFLFSTILLGREGTPMHGWSQSLNNSGGMSEKEVMDIIAFLRLTQTTEKQYISTGIVLGNKEKGEQLFKDNCVECHGKEAEGVKAPSLNTQEFLNGATNGFLMATVVLGRENSSMPSWVDGQKGHRKFSQDELNDVIAYIRSLQTVKIKR